jgi:hypothetical protein
VAAKTVGAWHLDPLFFLILHSLTIFLPFVPSEEHGVEAHFVKESCVGVRMTERINLPSNSRLDSKLLENPLLAIHHVVDHIVIGWARLIVHGPPSIEELNLTSLDENLDLLFLLIGLLIVPLLEESHFTLGEFSLGILE